MAGDQRPLWRCPKCGKQFVAENLWHSCYQGSVDDFFSGRPVVLRRINERYLATAESFGPVIVDVAKTRINFQGRVRFAVSSGCARTRSSSASG